MSLRLWSGLPQRGPYEASEGIDPSGGQGKTGGGQVFLALKRLIYFSLLVALLAAAMAAFVFKSLYHSTQA